MEERSIFIPDTEPESAARGQMPGLIPPVFPLLDADFNYLPEKYASYLHSITKQIDRPDLKVYKSNPYITNKICLKIICCGDNEEHFKRAVRECEITERLRGNSGIVWLLDCDIDPDNRRVALLEEEERGLTDYLSSEELHLLTLIQIGTGILDSLMQIQEAGYLYIDVHPGNLYYNEKHIKVGDFGNVIKLEEAGMYHDLTGVRNFMAPEVWRERIYSVQSVLYSTGMVLYWILNRCTPPFRPVNTEQDAFQKRMAGEEIPIPQMIQKYPEEMKKLYRWIQKMTAYHPEDRYNSFEEARKDLAEIGYDSILKEMEKPSDIYFTVGPGDQEMTVRTDFYADRS